jgi:hypothetical protein
MSRAWVAAFERAELRSWWLGFLTGLLTGLVGAGAHLLW